jgi:hemoglobin
MNTIKRFLPILATTRRRSLQIIPVSSLLLLTIALAMTFGCGGAGARQKKGDEFFTSGSREADQRASQRMAQTEQLANAGGSGEKGAQQASSAASDTSIDGPGSTNKAAQVEGKLALFERLGGEAGVSNIVADFMPRVLQDPRVNWQRKGVERGGFSVHSGKSVTWSDTDQNVELLKKHLIQFLALATGGPAHYEGKGIKATHAHMHISNPEFDAAIGDLKASLDKLRIPNKEQKELLAIIESTRPQIVVER